ncbi:zinc-binding alcohol dehydrogenase family protein [Natribaculum luteum]|uniref:Zinc-binding alcohol dehydrogenase family protein n=1 Tax=Natribaculum luteum TaxID=1586232 RepID=A0ABD5P299_9EURY|nr:NADPH:quinone reductase [Natribaculum luteum]
MDAVRYYEFGDESEMTLETVERPEPGDGEVLVEIEAIGVNPVDAKLREGALPQKQSLPQTMGTDLAGRVVRVDQDVDAFDPDDRVYGTGFGWNDPGTYAEFAAVPADRLAEIPDGVTFADAAAASLVGATAWQALVDQGDITVGDTCLIHGGTGGVGHIAVQLAVAAGCRVVATARAGEPIDTVERLGAVGVDYRSDNLAEDLQDALDGQIADVILETHAHANLAADVHVAGRGSTVAIIGTGDPVVLSPTEALDAMLNRVDLRFSSIMSSPEIHQQALSRLAKLLNTGDVNPIIAETYPLEDAGAALVHAQTANNVGKVVIDV